MVACAVFYILYVVNNFKDTPSINFDISSVLILLVSVFLVTLNTVIAGIIWFMLLRDFNVQLPIWKVQVIFLLSQFAKYLPGNIGHYVGRVYLSNKHCIPVSITINTMLMELIWLFFVGICLSLVAIFLIVDIGIISSYVHYSMTQLIVLGAILFITPWIIVAGFKKLEPFIRRFTSDKVRISYPKPKSIVILIFLYVICFFSIGIVLWLQAKFIYGDHAISVISITVLFAIAWTAGYITPGAPGGIGVREAVMVIVLSQITSPGIAIGLSITFRITTTASDLLAFLIGTLIKYISVNKRNSCFTLPFLWTF